MERVAITGLGLVTSIGIGRADFWSALTAGRSGISRVESFDPSAYSAELGGEVRGFDPDPYIRRQSGEQMGRASRLAIAAARLALDDARLVLSPEDAAEHGVVMGTTSGEPRLIEQYNDTRQAEDSSALTPEFFPQYPCQVIPARIARELELRGPSLTIPTACAAGAVAIGYGCDLLRSGRTKMMLCGGADAFSRITYMGFARLGAIAPERCRPFDRNREGMIPGEGAAVLVLERLSDAQARGAKIYAETLGYGVRGDAHHMTAGHPEGRGAVAAMRAALRGSGVEPDEVDYVSAHGTGTRSNDRMESVALHELLGERAARVPISSIKSMLGHTMGAASAIEAAACCLALDTGVIAPTINFEEPDPECPVDCVPNQARQAGPKIVLNNAYAFGGVNASLCLRRYEEPSA